jgi:hypothetical protein
LLVAVRIFSRLGAFVSLCAPVGVLLGRPTFAFPTFLPSTANLISIIVDALFQILKPECADIFASALSLHWLLDHKTSGQIIHINADVPYQTINPTYL